MQVVVLQDFKWYDFILKLHKLYNGTHLSVNNVSSRRSDIFFLCVLNILVCICPKHLKKSHLFFIVVYKV